MYHGRLGVRGLIRAGGIEIIHKLETRVATKMQSPIVETRDKSQLNEEHGPHMIEL